MALSTKEFENKIDKMHSIDELREMLCELPKITFSDRIYELCEERQLNFSQVQRECGITKSYFYDFANGTRTPKKHHVIKIGMAMHLTVEEMNELLKLAQHKELYAKRQEDAIIIFGIKNNLTAMQIDELLVESGSTFSLSEK